MHRGRVDPGVSELSRGNELSRDHVNRPLDYPQKYVPYSRVEKDLGVFRALCKGLFT